MCFYLRNWQVTFLLYTLGVFMSEYIAKASIEPRDYRVVFLIQKYSRSLKSPAVGVKYKYAKTYIFTKELYFE